MLPLFLLFVFLPIAEIMLIINVSQSIGGWNTFFVVVLTAFLGAYFVRQQGFALIQEIQTKLASGEPPGSAMAQGLLLLVAGVLLITPGFITDIVGFLFTLPFSREPIARFLMTKLIIKHGQGGAFGQQNFYYKNADSTHNDFDSNNEPFEHAQATQKEKTGDIIDGEYVDKTANDKKNRLN